jgi:transcription antitermination factor NusA-like protein
MVNQATRIFEFWQWLSKILYKVRLVRKSNIRAANLTVQLVNGIEGLRSQTPGIFSQSPRISFVKNADDFSEMDDGTIVLYVKDNGDQDRVLAESTMLYFKKAVIYEARPYVDRKLLRAFDVILAERALVNAPGACTYLQHNYLDPLLVNDRILYQIADELDQEGILTRVVLREFGNLGKRLKGKKSTARIRTETINFAKFAERIVAKELEDTPLRFVGNQFQSTIALIARPEQVRRNNLELYKRKFRTDIDNGTRAIYLLARGHDNVSFTKYLANWAVDEGLISKMLPNDYYLPSETGTPIITSCVACYSSKIGSTIQLSPVDEIYSALAVVIPEILFGDVEVVGVTREPNIRTKVMVRRPDKRNPIGWCVGTKGKNIEKLHSILQSKEDIDFIEWKRDIEEIIVAALYPMLPEDVSSIEINDKELQAKVIIKTRKATGFAIGKNGVNVKLANKLTGYHITIKATDDMESLEDTEALRVISKHVESIRYGKIEVVKLVRRQGTLTKVLLTSKHTQKPSETCSSSMVDIRKELGETVHFIDENTDAKEQIINALHPLDPQEIGEISINPDMKVVDVDVTTFQAQKTAIGHDKINIELAAQLIGYRKINIRV